VSTLDQKCETCGETRECQGHFGHIKLNEPVFHYGFMEYVEKILKCICHNCSKLKIFQVFASPCRTTNSARSSDASYI
jgi:DNA-directed RNA polymerase beta' subunit